MSRSHPLFLALLALPLACSEPSEGGGARPSVVLVTLDTTRADYLGCYGRPGDPTPHLDALAADGALFELCISSSAVTPVSHASILTGLEPYQHGLRVMYAGSGFRLPESVPLLSEALKAEGYRTAALLSAYPVCEDFGFDRGFDHFDWPGPDSGSATRVEDGRMSWDTASFQRRSDVTTDLAIEWLSEVEGPFFLWVHYWDPHDGGSQPPEDFLRRFEVPSGAVSSQSKAFYAAEVSFVDAQFGRLVDHLRETGRFEDTALAVISDHGEGLGDHGWHSHRILYQEQIHLPLILRLPEGPRGLRLPQLVRGIDVYPTILEALDLPSPGRVEGRSLVGLMAGRAEEPRSAYAEQLNQWDLNARMVERRPLDGLLHLEMDARWKLIHRPGHPERGELYDLAADPEESRNLYSQRPEVVARLMERMRARGEIFVHEAFPETADGSLPNTAALEALGYAGAEEETEEGGG